MKRALLAIALFCAPLPAFAAEKESAYDRVIAGGTLRCGYGTSAPILARDPANGTMSGVMFDVMNELGKMLSLKIEWAEELDWGALGTALDAQRVDAICSTVWVSAARGRGMAFTDPVFFSKIDAFVRADDKRFTGNPAEINDPGIRIAVNDSDVTEYIADDDFPRAEKVYKAAMTGEEFLLVDVMNNKADITFTHITFAQRFMDKNPGKLKRLDFTQPLRLYHNALATGIREQELRDMLNAALTELHGSGKLDRILDSYGDQLDGLILRVPPAYGAKP